MTAAWRGSPCVLAVEIGVIVALLEQPRMAFGVVPELSIVPASVLAGLE